MSTREEKANLTVHGWIREASIISVTIPVDIIKLCILFYLNQMAFYKEMHGDGLEFNDEENIVTFKTKKQSDGTCLFGVPVSAEYCDSFNISFKWMKSDNTVSIQRGLYYYNIMMGWITNTIDKSIGDWNCWLGHSSNEKYSRGIFGGDGYSNFYLYKDFPNNATYEILSNKVCSNNNANEGDEFKLSFDFKNDKVLVYRNKVLTTEVSLEGDKQIIPGLSLFYKGQRIKVVGWEFCKGNKTWS